jgi:hypothetical protein
VSEPRVPFTDREMRFCRVAAAASANALKNALLHRDVASEAARHRTTGEKLRRAGRHAGRHRGHRRAG